MTVGATPRRPPKAPIGLVLPRDDGAEVYAQIWDPDPDASVVETAGRSAFEVKPSSGADVGSGAPGATSRLADGRESEPRPRERLPLLILDGIGCSGWAFHRILPLLAAERRVIVMHYRGHGQSPTPPRPWRLDLEVLAGDAYAILDKVGATPAIAVGFSMGFSVALELWRWRRPSLAGIVNLAGPPGRVLADLEPTDALGQALPFVIAATRSASDLTLRLWKRVLPSPFARLVAMRTQVNASRLAVSDFEVYLRQLAEVNPELFIALLDAANAYDPRGFLADIDVPVLVVAGAQDKFVGLETLRRTAFALPRGQFQVFPDASHAIPAEYPHEVARRIDRFARELEGETVTAR